MGLNSLGLVVPIQLLQTPVIFSAACFEFVIFLSLTFFFLALGARGFSFSPLNAFMLGCYLFGYDLQ